MTKVENEGDSYPNCSVTHICQSNRSKSTIMNELDSIQDRRHFCTNSQFHQSICIGLFYHRQALSAVWWVYEVCAMQQDYQNPDFQEVQTAVDGWRVLRWNLQEFDQLHFCNSTPYYFYRFSMKLSCTATQQNFPVLTRRIFFSDTYRWISIFLESRQAKTKYQEFRLKIL